MTQEEQIKAIEHIVATGGGFTDLEPIPPKPHIDRKPSRKSIKAKRRQQKASRKSNRKK